MRICNIGSFSAWVLSVLTWPGAERGDRHQGRRHCWPCDSLSQQDPIPWSCERPQGGPNSWKIAAKERFHMSQLFFSEYWFGVCKLLIFVLHFQERVDAVKDLMFLARELQHPKLRCIWWVLQGQFFGNDEPSVEARVFGVFWWVPQVQGRSLLGCLISLLDPQGAQTVSRQTLGRLTRLTTEDREDARIRSSEPRAWLKLQVNLRQFVNVVQRQCFQGNTRNTLCPLGFLAEVWTGEIMREALDLQAC